MSKTKHLRLLFVLSIFFVVFSFTPKTFAIGVMTDFSNFQTNIPAGFFTDNNNFGYTCPTGIPDSDLPNWEPWWNIDGTTVKNSVFSGTTTYLCTNGNPFIPATDFWYYFTHLDGYINHFNNSQYPIDWTVPHTFAYNLQKNDGTGTIYYISFDYIGGLSTPPACTVDC